MKLEAIFKHKKGLEYFIYYLVSEYSIENILCFIEILEYQKFIMERNDDCCDFEVDINTGRTIDNLLGNKIQFYNNMVKSAMIYDKTIFNSYDGLVSLKTIAYEIYLKYFDSKSKYYVNIPKNDRKRLSNFLKNYQKWMDNDRINVKTLLYLYENIGEHILSNLKESWMRFQKTNDFKRIKKLIFL